MDGWMDDGWMDDGWMNDGWMMDGWMTDGWWMDGWRMDDGWMMDGWMTDGWMMDGWMTDGWMMDGWWMDEWRMDDGWMNDGWIYLFNVTWWFMCVSFSNQLLQRLNEALMCFPFLDSEYEKLGFLPFWIMFFLYFKFLRSLFSSVGSNSAAGVLWSSIHSCLFISAVKLKA